MLVLATARGRETGRDIHTECSLASWLARLIAADSKSERERVQEAGHRKANNQRRTQVVQVSSSSGNSTSERMIWQDGLVMVR